MQNLVPDKMPPNATATTWLDSGLWTCAVQRGNFEVNSPPVATVFEIVLDYPDVGQVIHWDHPVTLNSICRRQGEALAGLTWGGHVEDGVKDFLCHW